MPENRTVSFNRHLTWSNYPHVYEFLTHGAANVPQHDWAGFSAALARFTELGACTIGQRRLIDNYISENNWTPPSNAALALDVPRIPNGKCSVTSNDGYERKQYDLLIYTVTRGQWAGRRVIKLYSENGYAAVAFLNVDGTHTMWSRSADSEIAVVLPFALQMMRENSHRCLSEDGSVSYRIYFGEAACRTCNGETQDRVTQFCYMHDPSTGNLEADNRRRNAFRAASDLARNEIPNERITSVSFENLDDPEPEQPMYPQRSTPLPMCEITGSEVR